MSDEQKYGLAIHTTTPQLGIALSNFAGDTRCQTWDLGYELSSYLHQYLMAFLSPQTWCDLNFIAVAKGPGGFTGTRIGVVTARTLAQQLNIPLFGISTLAAIAWTEQIDNPLDSPIAVQMEARRGEIFAGIYQISSDRQSCREYLPDTSLTPEAWQKKLANFDLNCRLINAPANIGNTASSILELAHLEYRQGIRPQWAETVPYYGQSPV
jgi:tRNA threonylcarbamoyl adenosine modification protein YeaZ